jgi:hypothetical protein
MKIIKMLIIACLLLVGSFAFAEDETFVEKMEKRTPPATLFGLNKLYFSGCGGLVSKFTEFDGTYGALMGGRGGMIINDSLFVGGGGFGFTRNMKRTINSEEQEMAIGYGGMILEYFFFPKSLVHFSFGVLGGVGSVQYWPKGQFNINSNDEGYNFPSDEFWVVEPEFNIYLNITRFCKLGVGTSYRYVGGINTDGISEKGFSRFSGTAMLSFGWF